MTDPRARLIATGLRGPDADLVLADPSIRRDLEDGERLRDALATVVYQGEEVVYGYSEKAGLRVALQEARTLLDAAPGKDG